MFASSSLWFILCILLPIDLEASCAAVSSISELTFGHFMKSLVLCSVSDEAMKSSQVTCVLTRVLSLAGQVAFSQAVYMEVDVLAELKRRQAVSEESKAGGRRKSKVAANSKVCIF